MDWPSRELSQRLAEWRLCTPQDVQRCRAPVKRFVRDLPSFDSIWIDVLLQKRLLTPYQARILDSADPDRLVLAGHVLCDSLEENAWRAVYRARPIDGQTRHILTVHGIHTEDRTRAIDAIDETIARLRGATIPGLNIPERAEVGGRELFVFSPNLSGSSLRELLVRRGRFPEGAVLAIARELTVSLAALEERGVPHGDVRARNVWLDDGGRIHLLHAGILPAIMPTFLVSQELPLEVCDGVAPEATAGGVRGDSLSDQYSLGCLLWQLLAGRAPFATGDPHGKVAAHRTKDVPDIRDVAPQVSERLGRVVKKLTSRSRAGRFASFRELAIELGNSGHADRKQLTRFFRTFETDAPTQTARIATEKTKQLPSALAAVVIGGATVWLFTSDPASFGERARRRTESTAPRPLPEAAQARPIADVARPNEPAVIQTAGVREAHAQPLPAPDAAGVITLTPGVEYTPRTLKAPGPIVIRTTGGLARIAIREAPWEVAADSVELENVQLEATAPIRVQSRGLKVLHSAVVGAGDSAAIEWRPADAAAASPGTLLMTDSHVSGGGLACAIRPSLVRVANCLKSGGGAMIVLPATGRAHHTTQVQAIHVTLRGTGPLLEWASGSRAAGMRVEFSTKACLFAPESGSSVLALTGSLAPPDWERTISISGLESLLQSGAKVVDLAPAKGKPRGAIDTTKLEVDGLMTATLEFVGPNAEDVASCGLRSTDAPFSVDRPPGIDVEKVAIRISR